MSMEGPEELTVTGSNDHNQIAKAKRTKRPRPWSPLAMAARPSSLSRREEGNDSDCGGGGGGAEGDGNGIHSPSTISEISSSTDEDLANCLILLAQSGTSQRQVAPEENINAGKSSSKKLIEMASDATTKTRCGKVGFYAYECKTCDRTFPSFQALGGHRASHKKPKATTSNLEDKRITMAPLMNGVKEQEEKRSSGQLMNKIVSIPPLLVYTSKNSQGNMIMNRNKQKPKIHECLICGSEFTSGQALGGHMRRHRTAAPTSSAARIVTMSIESSTHEALEEPAADRISILPLDLNLPAVPEDDHPDSNLKFTTSQQHQLVFSVDQPWWIAITEG